MSKKKLKLVACEAILDVLTSGSGAIRQEAQNIVNEFVFHIFPPTYSKTQDTYNRTKGVYHDTQRIG